MFYAGLHNSIKLLLFYILLWMTPCIYKIIFFVFSFIPLVHYFIICIIFHSFSMLLNLCIFVGNTNIVYSFNSYQYIQSIVSILDVYTNDKHQPQLHINTNFYSYDHNYSYTYSHKNAAATTTATMADETATTSIIISTS